MEWLIRCGVIRFPALLLGIALVFPWADGIVHAGGAEVLLAADRTEPIVAIDPRHPSEIVAGSNTNYDVPVNGSYPVEAFASSDGGASFSATAMPVMSPYTTGADPDVAIDNNGTVFFSYLGEAPSYCSDGPGAVLVAHSIDHGKSFRGLTAVDRNPDDDKPLMAVRSERHKPSHLFLAWTRFHSHTSDIWFSRSTDGGAHFTSPTLLYSSRNDNTGAEPVMGPSGHLYVVWANFSDGVTTTPARSRLLMRRSTDDGATFSPVQQVGATFQGVPHMSQPGALRNITFPSMVALSSGRLLLAWAQVSSDHGGGRTDDDIVVRQSVDSGARWSVAHRVNDDRSGDRFMPQLTVLRGDRVGIVFYDRRAGGSTLRVYGAVIRAGSSVAVGRNVRIDTGTSPVSDIYYLAPGSTCFTPGRFFGDYIGVARCGAATTVCVVWSDTQLHVANQTDVWFRKLELPAPTPGAAWSSARGTAASRLRM